MRTREDSFLEEKGRYPRRNVLRGILILIYALAHMEISPIERAFRVSSNYIPLDSKGPETRGIRGEKNSQK